MKKIILCSFILATPLYSFANETILFSCTTENNEFRLVERQDKLELEYQVVNRKTGNIGFSFTNHIDDVKSNEGDYEGNHLKGIELKNKDHAYVLISAMVENKFFPMAVFAKDPNGKLVSKNSCQEFVTAKKQDNNKQIQSSQTVVLEDGMYRVGKDIPAGEYKLTATGEFGGSFTITKDSSHTFESIIAIDSFQKTTFITVKDGQYLELKGCIAEMEK